MRSRLIERSHKICTMHLLIENWSITADLGVTQLWKEIDPGRIAPFDRELIDQRTNGLHPRLGRHTIVGED